MVMCSKWEDLKFACCNADIWAETGGQNDPYGDANFKQQKLFVNSDVFGKHMGVHMTCLVWFKRFLLNVEPFIQKMFQISIKPSFSSVCKVDKQEVHVLVCPIWYIIIHTQTCVFRYGCVWKFVLDGLLLFKWDHDIIGFCVPYFQGI